jgi:hypothetical protein
MFTRKVRCVSRCLTVAVVGLLACAISCAGGAGAAVAAVRAAQGYGPPPPGGGTTPGGYFGVVTSRTISCASGGLIGPTAVNAASVALAVPATACVFSVQVTLTTPDLGLIPGAGFPRYRSVADFGVQIQQHGGSDSHTLLKPFMVTIRSPLIIASSIVAMWNGAKFLTVPAAVVGNGTARVGFDGNVNFTILTPAHAVRPSRWAPAGRSQLRE